MNVAFKQGRELRTDGWKELGQYVRKGEKALALCMPVRCKRRESEPQDQEALEVVTCFVYCPHWFVLSRTDSKDYVPEPVAGWDADTALRVLDIQRVPFMARQTDKDMPFIEPWRSTPRWRRFSNFWTTRRTFRGALQAWCE